jgi:prepilin-type N-terminal cleavage/methylation domain-containing protein
MIEKMNKGFTLIELAIVVVVLGILITGIIGGQSLIESAKKREVITGFTQLRTGLNAFKLEFDAIPGDMEDAYDYWGDDCSSSEGRCNGDGDNKITSGNSNFERYCWSIQCEKCMFYKHMSLAGILNEKIDCINEGPFEENNSIRNPLKYKSYFFVSNRCIKDLGYYDCDTTSEYTSGLYLMGGSTGPNEIEYPWVRCNFTGSFTPKQQKYIDEKLDDGKPKTGKFVAVQLATITVGCHNSTIVSGPCLLNNTENAYNVANDDYVCQMHYRLDL